VRRPAGGAHALLSAAAAVLVDLDGTLVESSGPVRRAWAGFAGRYGLDPDVVHDFAQGRPSRETIRLLAPQVDPEAEAAAVERSELSDIDGVRPLPGAAELLAGDRALAIVTSCSHAQARTRLRAAGLAVPSVVVSSDDVTRGKPDPECYLTAARLLGAPASRCVVIEDAPIGIAAGRAAGAVVIALRTTHADEALRHADAIIDDLAVLVDRARRRRRGGAEQT